jgi:2-polyprenyl-3-methyl-5-hydroxy-6-metoxy-1,4-benzoquinol methylase
MIDYSKRSYQKELLDGNDIPFEDIVLNMKELDFINSNLGGHAISIEGFKKLIGQKKRITVCEIGCGGGDNLNAINDYCIKNDIEASFIGIDINKECIDFARQHCKTKNVLFIGSDYKQVQFENGSPDIIFSSLFCHHFTDAELVKMLIWMESQSTHGFFINDLHRHPLAYHFIKIATRVFSKSYLVKNDAPLSVLRSFKKNDWERLLKAAGLNNYNIKWKWAFRYLVMKHYQEKELHD